MDSFSIIKIQCLQISIKKIQRFVNYYFTKIQIQGTSNIKYIFLFTIAKCIATCIKIN